MIQQDVASRPVPAATLSTVNASMTTAVKQASFVARHQATWQAFDELCRQLGVEVSSPVAAKSVTTSKSSTLTQPFFKKNKSAN